MKTKKLLKNFLVKVEVMDGEHAHFTQCLIAEPTEERAYDWADSQKNLEATFLYGDDLASVSLVCVKEITDAQAELLETLGVAYFI